MKSRRFTALALALGLTGLTGCDSAGQSDTPPVATPRTTLGTNVDKAREHLEAAGFPSFKLTRDPSGTPPLHLVITFEGCSKSAEFEVVDTEAGPYGLIIGGVELKTPFSEAGIVKDSTGYLILVSRPTKDQISKYRLCEGGL